MMTRTLAPRGTTTELHLAAAGGDLEAVRRHLADGQLVDCRDPEGYTPFLLACRHSEPTVFHALLEAGADCEAANIRGMSGLFLVATTGVVSLARVLIDRGAAVNRPAARGLTPLLAGIMSGNWYMVRLLITAGAELELCDANGTNALRWAKRVGTPELVDLIRNPERAHDTVVGTLGPIDLHRGARTGDVELIRECLSSGVPINSTDDNGSTPLMLAARHGKRAAIQALLEAGADPYRNSASGITALLLAANNPTALGAFIRARVNLNHGADRRGTTALQYAAGHGFDDVVRVLLAAGAEPDCFDADGRSAFDHAIANGHRTIARLLSNARIAHACHS
jgi:ankyrin repeat protein